MNKEDLSKYEKEGLRGLTSYQETVEFALDCIGMKEPKYAVRALELLNNHLKIDLLNHGVIMID